MQLSDKAIQELRMIIQQELGVEFYNSLQKEDLNEIGLFILNLLSESLKINN
jgi:hypothetical protein